MPKKMIVLFVMSLLLPLLAACGGETATSTAVAVPTATAMMAAPTNTAMMAAPTNTTASGSTGAAGPTSTKGMTFALVPKNLGNPYFDTANKGAQAAATELGISVTYTGPATADATQQIQLLNTLISQHVAGMAISADDSDALVATGKTAMGQNIPVVSWDSAIAPGGRNVHINQAKSEDIGRSEIALAAKLIGGSGEIAILSATSTAPNQNEWIEFMKDELTKPEYANVKLVDTVYGDDDDSKSYTQAQALMQSHPNLKAIISPTTVGIAAAARAVTDGGMIGKVMVTGLGTPNTMRAYVKSGAAPAFELWNPSDLGYLAIHTLNAIASGQIKGNAGDTFTAGKLGSYTIEQDGTILLGVPTVFDSTNIDNFDF